MKPARSPLDHPAAKALLLGALLAGCVLGQENYEIQVYAAPTVAPGMTMVEAHTNFTFEGTKKVEDGMRPTNHSLHETFEITHGFNDWFETGFYIFTSYNPGYGWQWVGNHIRPRVRAPDSWKLPFGLSLSPEFGYQRRQYSGDTWSIELRPIIDKDFGKVYLGFNPTFDRAFHGLDTNKGLVFSPNFKASYKISKRVDVGMEYYGSVGRFSNIDPLREQQQQFIPSIDLDLGDQWEFNFGVGVGVTQSTDHLLVKLILGRRFSFGSRKTKKGT